MSNWKDFALLALKVICATVIFMSMISVFYAVGPRMETKWWPVVSKLKVLTMETTPENFTKIRVQFTKLRECDYLGMAWFVGDRPDDFERVAVSIMRDPTDTGSPNRPLGTQRSGPWVVAVTPEEFKEASFAQLFHRCHPFWNSVTEFYP